MDTFERKTKEITRISHSDKLSESLVINHMIYELQNTSNSRTILMKLILCVRRNFFNSKKSYEENPLNVYIEMKKNNETFA